MSSTTPPPTDALALGPELTISQAAAVRDALVDALCATAGDLQLDLGAVAEIDSAGVQLLLATRRSVAERGATGGPASPFSSPGPTTARPPRDSTNAR